MDKKDRIYEKAKKRVDQKKAFFQTSILFTTISIVLLIIAFIYTPHNIWWVSFPVIGFMIASFIQYTELYGFSFFGEEWEDQELEKEIARQKYKQDLKDYLENPENSDLEELELREIESKYSNDDFV